MDAHFDEDFLSRAGEMTQQVKGICLRADGLSLIPSTQVRGVKAYTLSPNFFYLLWHMHTETIHIHSHMSMNTILKIRKQDLPSRLGLWGSLERVEGAGKGGE